MEIDITTDLAPVIALPVKFKEQTPDAPIFVPPMVRCYHTGGYIFDDSLEHVKCKSCGENLNPMYVLKQLSQQESRWRIAAASYQNEMQRLRERSKTKCQHCGQMTRISKA